MATLWNSLTYTSFGTEIVGCDHYKAAYAYPNKPVLLQREPENPRDANAICVTHTDGAIIGHLPKHIAAKLANFMDSGELRIRGRVTGDMFFGNYPLKLTIYGPGKPSQEVHRIARAMASLGMKPDLLGSDTESEDEAKDEDEDGDEGDDEDDTESEEEILVPNTQDVVPSSQPAMDYR